MPASTYLANELLDHVLRGAGFAAPSAIYISLHTGDPGNDGSNEVGTGAWPAYARQDAADGGALTDAFDAAASKATSNANLIEWSANDGSGPVTVTHFGIWDAGTDGNYLMGGALASSKALAVGDELKFRIGEIDVEFDPS